HAISPLSARFIMVNTRAGADLRKPRLLSSPPKLPAWNFLASVTRQNVEDGLFNFGQRQHLLQLFLFSPLATIPRLAASPDERRRVVDGCFPEDRQQKPHRPQGSLPTIAERS